MNIKFKDTPHTSAEKRKTDMAHVPLSHQYLSLSKPQITKFNRYEERPFKTNLQNLSFEGLSSILYKRANEIPYDKEEILKIADEHLGKSARELFNDLQSKPQFTKKLFNVDNQGKVIFHKKTIPHLIYDEVIYPIKILPADLLNGIVGALRKIKPLKNWADNLYHSQFFRNIRQRSKIDSKVNALNGLFETIHGIKGKSKEEISAKLFQQSTKMFDASKGSYDTKHERSLNRIVSGSIPAFFLANDAYNLSRMCNDNEKDAKKEKKIRFKQEVSRVGVNAYITLVTMGALQKYINNSKYGVMLTIGGTALVTEMFSRLINGKHIVMLSPEKAKQINAKDNKNTKEIAAEDKYKEVFFRATDETKPVKKTIEKAPAKEVKSDKLNSEKKQAPLMNFNTIMKASAIIIGAGFGIKGLRTYKWVDKVFKDIEQPLNKWYKNLTVNPEYKIKEGEFNKIVKKLEDNGFKSLANKYREVANKSLKNGYIDLGEKNKKAKLAVDFVIAPFKFIFNTIKIPYTLAKKGVEMLEKKPPKEVAKLDDLNKKALAKSIEKIGKEALKEKNFDADKFKSFVNENILKSFNDVNLSNVSNSDLANIAKTSATVATIWFLMADNYNMVMLKSNGEDKEGAQLKAKERFIQEGSRLFYQTLLISLFNGTFKSQYNNSLFGMSWVTAICTYIGENLNRKSVGMPVKPHTRDELLAIEQKKEETTGLLKGYYNFMSKLTGKKSLSEQHKIKQEKTTKV